MVVLCSIGEGEAGLYRLHGVLRELTDDEGGHGAPDDQRRGRGHGGGQAVRASVMRVLAQWAVVKNSGECHASVLVVVDRGRRARRLVVERRQLGMSSGLWGS